MGVSFRHMTETLDAAPLERRRRSDAQRSIDAIVGAARALLRERPDGSMEEIAAAAGVTRQTVYAHYASREVLMLAVIEKEKAECLAALNVAHLDSIPPVEALCRFLEITWQLFERCPVLHDPALARMRGPKGEESRQAVTTLVEDIVRRGQRSGDFDPDLPPGWLAVAMLGLGHTTAVQVTAGTMSAEGAAATLVRSALRLCGCEGIDPIVTARPGATR
jgi:AcrR family transcriptional regulator